MIFVLYARKVFAVTKAFVIMAMSRDDGCDLASHERSDASRAPSADRHCRIAQISCARRKVFAISVTRRASRRYSNVTRIPRRLIRIRGTSGAEGYSGGAP
jgi:hypothetical protein